MKNIEGPCQDHEKCIHVINLVIDGEANKAEETFFYNIIIHATDLIFLYEPFVQLRFPSSNYLWQVTRMLWQKIL